MFNSQEVLYCSIAVCAVGHSARSCGVLCTITGKEEDVFTSYQELLNVTFSELPIIWKLLCSTDPEPYKWLLRILPSITSASSTLKKRFSLT